MIGIVVFGLILAILGLLMALWPRPLVAAASRYRIWMPDRATPHSVLAARIGALLVMTAGLVVSLALA